MAEGTTYAPCQCGVWPTPRDAREGRCRVCWNYRPVEPRGAAVLSACGLYRYSLQREVGDGANAVLFVMLNPSTADAFADDPTIRRCIGFARTWYYGVLLVGNLYAYRATKPAVLREAGEAGVDPIGRENDRELAQLAGDAALVVAAWGANADVARALAVIDLLREAHGGPLFALGHTMNGAPRHPLYVRGDADLVPLGETD